MRLLYFLLLPSLGISYEIAFSNHNLEEDLPAKFRDKPLPDFNWSVYPRFRCNAVNTNGLEWEEGYPNVIKDVLVRTAAGGSGPPGVMVFYSTDVDLFDNPDYYDLRDPCSWRNARDIVRWKNGTAKYLDRGVGNSQKYNLATRAVITYWKELEPNEPIPEEWESLISRIRPGRSAVWDKSDDLWEIPGRNGRGIPGQRGDVYSGGFFTDYWYKFSEHGARQVMMLRAFLGGPDDGDGSEGGDDENWAQEDSDDDGSVDTAYTTDVMAQHELINREPYPWQPPQPRMIRNNVRWIYRPTREDARINPEYRRWRNERIMNAGDYRPVATTNKDGVESSTAVPLNDLIAEGWIIDRRAELEFQDKLARERKGVAEAEIFYKLLVDDEKSQRQPQALYDEMWKLESPGWKMTDPLPDMLSVNTDENDVLFPVNGGGGGGQAVAPAGQNQAGMNQAGVIEDPLAAYWQPTVLRPAVDNRAHQLLSGPNSPD
ncbi:hypothetical protein TWF730_010880 [Orbilia blumenaviensis]|uniref:Uncharacterized protein n=1 Tax=Orbilia blumenaviensis TaxID=1796055 RepID=A0AAV9UJW1_9PEZI